MGFDDKSLEELKCLQKERDVDGLRRFLDVWNVTNEYGVFTRYEALTPPPGKAKPDDIDGNAIYVASNGNGLIWFSAYEYTSFSEGSLSHVSVLGTPYDSRTAAIFAACVDFRRHFSGDKKKVPARDKKLNKGLSEWIEALFDDIDDASEEKKCSHEHPGCCKNWCDKCKKLVHCCADCGDDCNVSCGWVEENGWKRIDAEYVPSDDGRGFVEDKGGQLRLNGGEDGFVRQDDIEGNSRVRKIYAAEASASCEKKQMSRRVKALGRWTFYLSIAGVIESVKAKSALEPDELWFAADAFNGVVEMNVGMARELPEFIEHAIIYAVFLNGEEVEKDVLRAALKP